MKKIRVEDAVGMTLCHDVTKMADGFKGPAFRRGHVIRPEDVEELLSIGKKTVFIWEENAGEMHEEECAKCLAEMAPVEGARYQGPSEGKMVLIAEERGLFRVDTELLEKLNRIGDITITTLPDHYPAEKGMPLASMRIVPLTTQVTQIEAARRLCEGRRLMRLLPYRPRKIGVIITGSEVYSGRIRDKFEPVVREKMRRYPAEILSVAKCDDDIDMILSAARTALDRGADFLIFTGGMSVDPDDLTPTAIRTLGASVVSHGVPSQPGNMTLMAYLGGIPVMGVPGAAISLPTTVFDVLLPQIFTGEKLTKDDLVRLGDGGLCQRCEKCHYPNCTYGRY